MRFLILARIDDATPYGLSARRLTHVLSLRPSTLAYHLDALEELGFVRRFPWRVHDRRRVAVRLTDLGRRAVGRLAGHPPP